MKSGTYMVTFRLDKFHVVGARQIAYRRNALKKPQSAPFLNFKRYAYRDCSESWSATEIFGDRPCVVCGSLKLCVFDTRSSTRLFQLKHDFDTFRLMDTR